MDHGSLVDGLDALHGGAQSGLVVEPLAVSMTNDKHPHSTLHASGARVDLKSVAFGLLETQNFESLSKLSKAMGCSYWTIYGWWRSDPAFADAFRASRQHAVDEVKETAFARATGADGQKPSDLLTMYILNNFDEEIVERMSKQRAEITIRLEVPALSASNDSWAAEVAKALPDAAVEAEYREILAVPKEA